MRAAMDSPIIFGLNWFPFAFETMKAMDWGSKIATRAPQVISSKRAGTPVGKKNCKTQAWPEDEN